MVLDTCVTVLAWERLGRTIWSWQQVWLSASFLCMSFNLPAWQDSDAFLTRCSLIWTSEWKLRHASFFKRHASGSSKFLELNPNKRRIKSEQKKGPSYASHAIERINNGHTKIKCQHATLLPGNLVTNCLHFTPKHKIWCLMWERAETNRVQTECLNLCKTFDQLAAGETGDKSKWKSFWWYQALWCVIQTGPTLEQIKERPSGSPRTHLLGRTCYR